MNAKKIEIATVVTRLFTNALGRTVDVNESVKSLNISRDKYSQAISKIEEIYGIEIGKKLNQSDSVEQIVNICYDEIREKTIRKVKDLIVEYHICLSEIYGPNMDSIH